MPSTMEGKQYFRSKISRTSVTDKTLQIELAEENPQAAPVQNLPNDCELINYLDKIKKSVK